LDTERDCQDDQQPPVNLSDELPFLVFGPFLIAIVMGKDRDGLVIVHSVGSINFLQGMGVINSWSIGIFKMNSVGLVSMDCHLQD